MIMKDNQPTYFLYDRGDELSKATYIVKGPGSKYLCVRSEAKRCIPPTRIPKLPEYSGMMSQPTLESFLDKTVAELEKQELSLLTGDDFCYLIKSVLPYHKEVVKAKEDPFRYNHKVAPAQKLLEKIQSCFELLDLGFVYVPKGYNQDLPEGGLFVINEALSRGIYNKLNAQLIPELIKEQKRLHSRICLIEPTFKTERLDIDKKNYKGFRRNPIVRCLSGTRSNASALARYLRLYEMQAHVWLPQVKEMPKEEEIREGATVPEIEFYTAFIGGDGHGKFAIRAGGYREPTVPAVIHGVAIKHLEKSQVDKIERRIKRRINLQKKISKPSKMGSLL